jgi:YbbR domain-containing protein
MMFLRDLFLRDIWLKLFSLALAVCVWKVVSLAIEKDVSPTAVLPITSTERVIPNVPVLVISAAAAPRAYKVNPSQVTITVRGETRLVEGLMPGEVRAVVDLTGIDSAVNLKKRIEILTPPGVTSHAEPEEVQASIPPH